MLKGLRLLWEVTGVSEGSVSSCIELLRQGHVLAIAPGSVFAQLIFLITLFFQFDYLIYTVPNHVHKLDQYTG